MRFTHLAVRTEFSIIDCIIRIKQLVKTAKDGQTSLGIADMSNMFAIVKFYKACLDENQTNYRYGNDHQVRTSNT